MLRIKRDDKVIVIAGKDKGKTGKVIKVFPARTGCCREHQSCEKSRQKERPVSERRVH
jgi:large subunit ribosomal protein L24